MKKWIHASIFIVLLTLAQATALWAQDNGETLAELVADSSLKVVGINSGITFTTALQRLEEKFDISFIYKMGLLEGVLASSDIGRSDNLTDELHTLLEPYNLKYTRLNNRTFALSFDFSKYALQVQEKAQEQISGTVTDAQSDETLPGVNILVKGTSTGASTNADGNFELTVESLQDTLVVSFVGYQTQEVPINGQTEINVALQSQAISGEEMVVIGYGQTSKKQLTGSVSSVQGEDLADVPVSGIGQALQGKATGVRVTRPSGDPNAGANIIIRGGNSINGDNSPLYVVDGIIEGQGFNLNNLNSNDIKSIDILKDATAVGIYGTQGSNGVVLITTKDGSGLEAGKTAVTFSAYAGTQAIQNKVDLLNGRERAIYSNQAAEYRNEPLPYPDLDLTGVPDTDWLSAITRRAPVYNGNLSISGVSADRKLNYYLSGGYFNQNGIVRASGIEKNQFRVNTDIKLSDYVKAGIRFKVSRNAHENNKVQVHEVVQQAIPSRPIYNEDGEFSAVNNPSQGGGNLQRNPVADITLREDQSVNTLLLGNAYIEVEPIKNLTVKANFSPTISELRLEQYNPSALPIHRETTQQGDGRIYTLTSRGLQNENTVRYSADFNADHHIDLLGGFTWQTNETKNSSANAFGFTNDAVKYNNLGLGSDPARNRVGSSYNSSQLVSWLGRINYSFRNKYLLTMVGRVDGSSRFATTKNQYGFFPSAAFAWRLSEEPFIKKLNIFDNLKLKTSYGISGSQSINSYRALALLQGRTVLFNEQPQAGIVDGRPANPDLQWETTKQLNIGLDAGFFGGRLSFNAEYYRKRTKDLLLDRQIPLQTGFGSKLVNIGAISNQGLEFEVNTENITKKDFQWSTRVTWSRNRNEVVDLGGSEFINTVNARIGAYARLIRGETAPVFVGVDYLGTWKSQEEIDESAQAGSGVVVGGPRFEDTDGDGQITVQDYHIIGSPEPDFYGGIGNTFRYKNIALNVFFEGTYGNEIFNTFSEQGFFGGNNMYGFTVNRWTRDNRDSNIPAAGTSALSPNIPSNRELVEDGSYFRLKNFRLSYDLPVKKINFTSLNKLSVFFSGTNVLLFSKFRLFDPETSLYGDSTTQAGFARGEYPYARTFTLGINASF